MEKVAPKIAKDTTKYRGNGRKDSRGTIPNGQLVLLS